MDLIDLKTFEAVARLGSMNKAAMELHTVQSNVTARIQGLEHELRAELFERQARGVKLTASGLRLLPFANRIALQIEQACSAVHDEGTPTGPLRLGSLESTAALRLSPWLSEYARRYPDVRLIVRTGTTAALTREVADGRLEGAFVAGPIRHPELVHETVFEEELVLVTAPFVRSPKELAQLSEVRTIVFQYGCSYRQRLESYLAGLGLVMAMPEEFGSLDMIMSCVAAGIGVTLLPRAVVAEATKRGRVVTHRLPAGHATVQTLFVRRRDAHVSSAFAAFVDMTRLMPEQAVRAA